MKKVTISPITVIILIFLASIGIFFLVFSTEIAKYSNSNVHPFPQENFENNRLALILVGAASLLLSLSIITYRYLRGDFSKQEQYLNMGHA